jgi:3-keto-disaccharide hydrolase
MSKLGYDDTPMLPGQQWHVHDHRRPQPRVITPGAEAGQAPSDAVVLFGGKDLSGWTGRDGEPAWKVEGGYMDVVPATGTLTSKERFGDCQLHLEFASPVQVKGDSQGRGNSGVFMMGLYEIQVLDGYDNPTYADGITASLYGEHPPLVNACRKPGEWQTYDIIWAAPRFSGVELVTPAYLTLLHNGVLVHSHAEVMGPTGHRNVYPYKAHAPAGPLELQDHGDLVRFRNIWYRPPGTCG